VTVTDALHARLHEVALLVRLDLSRRCPRARNAWLTRLLQRLQSPGGPDDPLSAALDRAVHRELSAVDRVARPAAERLLQRCQGIRHVCDSAAARLVQPDLFTRRAVPGVLEHERAAGDGRPSAAAAPVAGRQPLAGTAALTAALLVRPARRSR
jgi:hypothetical protein